MTLPDKYTRLKPLTPGKNATVYRARNELLQRTVFLKIFPFPENDERSALREPMRLAALNHENLAKIHSADPIQRDDERLICLEMAWISSTSFQDLISRAQETGRWPSSHTVMRLVIDVANALGYLHGNSLIHRDVKPANIMVREGGSRRFGVVTDLGLAIALDRTGRGFAENHARIYRPPETWRDEGYSIRSDIYQLGVVLYQLLGGEIDFDLEDDELEAVVCEGNLLDSSTLPWHIPRQLRQIIAKATAVVEKDRYESMGDFAVALNNALRVVHDWQRNSHQDGSTSVILTRGGTKPRLKLEIESDGSRHQVLRSKRGKSSTAWKRSGQQLVITHKNLASCQEFQTILADLW